MDSNKWKLVEGCADGMSKTVRVANFVLAVLNFHNLLSDLSLYLTVYAQGYQAIN